MIRATTDPGFESLVAHLAAMAQAIAEARAELRRSDPAKWRKARHVWPLFARR